MVSNGLMPVHDKGRVTHLQLDRKAVTLVSVLRNSATPPSLLEKIFYLAFLLRIL
jgi:hypothetical protein